MCKKFNEMVDEIEKGSKDICAKIYTGDNVKWLVGNDKIPEYLTAYLTGMKTSAENFRISCTRSLRTLCQDLLTFCEKLPVAVFSRISSVFEVNINKKVDSFLQQFNFFIAQDKESREMHLRKFRPNLENPANID